MTMMIRLLFLIGLFSFSPQISTAQSGGGVPDEELLNRYGLTLAWWQRAVIDGGRDSVLYVTADEQNLYVQSSSGILTTFNGESGRQMWSGLVGAPDQRGYAATSNDEQLLVSAGMQVYSFNKDTGELIWQLRSPKHPSTSPSVNEDQIAIGATDGSVFSFDINKVRELHEERMLPRWSHMARQWRFKSPTHVVSPPIFSGTTLVFASQRGIVYGMSSQDKKLKFQFETDAKIHTPLGSSREYILVTDDDSRMYCLNKETGRIRWTFSSGAPMKKKPMVIGQQVFVAPTREGLFSLSLVSGRVMWNYLKASEFLAASETRVYATDISGHLVILDRESGRLIGRIPLRQFTERVKNERTDRIYLADKSGLVLGIRELNSEFPAFHLYPERRPILPLMGPEEGEEAPMEAADENAAPAVEDDNPFKN